MVTTANIRANSHNAVLVVVDDWRCWCFFMAERKGERPGLDAGRAPTQLIAPRRYSIDSSFSLNFHFITIDDDDDDDYQK